jgi:hypothetical protein
LGGSPAPLTSFRAYYGARLTLGTIAGEYKTTITYTAIGAEVPEPPLEIHLNGGNNIGTVYGATIDLSDGTYSAYGTPVDAATGYDPATGTSYQLGDIDVNNNGLSVAYYNVSDDSDAGSFADLFATNTPQAFYGIYTLKLVDGREAVERRDVYRASLDLNMDGHTTINEVYGLSRLTSCSDSAGGTLYKATLLQQIARDCPNDTDWVSPYINYYLSNLDDTGNSKDLVTSSEITSVANYIAEIVAKLKIYNDFLNDYLQHRTLIDL